MHASKVEIAFGWYICDVGWYAALTTEFVDLGRNFGVIDGAKYHVYIVEVGGFEGAVEVRDLVAGYAICDFGVEVGRG